MSAAPKSPRLLDPALLAGGLLGAPDAEFARLAAAFRNELAPRDLLEVLQIDLALMSLALLRRALNALAEAPDDAKALRAYAQAHKMLTQALRESTRLRKRPSEMPAQAEEPPRTEAVAPTASPRRPAAPIERQIPAIDRPSPARNPPAPAMPPRVEPSFPARPMAVA